MAVTERDRFLLGRAVGLAQKARDSGNHPFGAVLADAEGNLLLEARNSSATTLDCTGHAETNLARLASTSFSRGVLAASSLYSSAEPCAMCAGAIYWAGIGRVVYALSESELLGLTGDDPENPTLSLPCREVFSRGQKRIEVEGPVAEIPGAREVHEGFWRKRN
jgi:tRNA(Arg) A34 adenosine deaminase TadA